MGSKKQNSDELSRIGFSATDFVESQERVSGLEVEVASLRELLTDWSDTIDDAKYFRYWVDELEKAVGIPPEIRSIATLRVKREYLKKMLSSYSRSSKMASGVLGKKFNDQVKDARSAIEKIDREIDLLRQGVPKNESKS